MNRLFSSRPARPFLEYRQRNLLHSLILLFSNALLAGFVGWVVAGGEGLVWALLLMAGLLFFMPRMAPRTLLRLYSAAPLSPAQAPVLHAIRDLLCHKAAIAPPPDLYQIPSQLMNAFAVGGAGDEPAALAMTDRLLRSLPPRELAAVMAHELSHLRHNDMRVMAMADVAGRVTSTFALMGQLLLLLHLPWLLVQDHPVPWLLILILLVAPMAAGLLQLALSRTRELDADLEAVRLCGDPLALASALARMETAQGSLLRQLFFPGRQDPNPSLFRTHPDTQERIARLQELARSQEFTPLLDEAALQQVMTLPSLAGRRFPRWRPWRM